MQIHTKKKFFNSHCPTIPFYSSPTPVVFTMWLLTLLYVVACLAHNYKKYAVKHP